jgi:1-deoxy-D-xylulose-5-phosphate reductoisomerase
MDFQRYPCLSLARSALNAGGVHATALNAANEIAVEAFLGRQLGFTEIAGVIEQCLNVIDRAPVEKGRIAGLDAVLAVDAWARSEAKAAVAGRGKYANA